MTYDLNAYLRRDHLPTASILQASLMRSGHHVVLPNIDDLTLVGGYIPLLLDGTPTGFELYADEITDAQRDDYRGLLKDRGLPSDQFLEILITSDLDIGFACESSDQRQIRAARLVAHALAEAAKGWFSDPQTGETIRYAVD